MEPMKYLEELVERYPVLDAVKDDVRKAYELLEACYEQGGKLLIAGTAEAVPTRNTLSVN